MAKLKCRHCEGEITSGSRQVQCPHCAALFPFSCAKCGCNLRTPFSVHSDERFLSHDNEPLCGEHFLRLCPDCNGWFHADENPGFFRCACCTAKNTPDRVAPWDTDNLQIEGNWIDADTGGRAQTAVLVAGSATSTRSPEMNIALIQALMNLFSRLLRHHT